MLPMVEGANQGGWNDGLSIPLGAIQQKGSRGMSATMILCEWTVSCPLLAAGIRLAGHWFPAFQPAVCQQRRMKKQR